MKTPFFSSKIGLLGSGIGALLTIAAVAAPSIASAQYSTYPYGNSYNMYYNNGYSGYSQQYPTYNYTYQNQNTYPYGYNSGYNSYYTGSNNTVSTPYWCGSYWSSQACGSYSNSSYTYPSYGNSYNYQYQNQYQTYPYTYSNNTNYSSNYGNYSNQNYWGNNRTTSYYVGYNGSCAPGYYLWGTNCWINPSNNQMPLMYSTY